MVLINDKKFACATCIKGHRVSGCTHTGRPLFEVKKKGRPTTQCQHCRDKRKNGTTTGSTVHTKCACGETPTPSVIMPGQIPTVTASASENEFSAETQTRKGQPGSKATFPNGLKDVHDMAEALHGQVADDPLKVAERKVAALLNPCQCTTGGKCRCCQPVRERSVREPSPNSSGARTPTHGHVTDSLIEMFKAKATTKSSTAEASCCGSSNDHLSISTNLGSGSSPLLSPRDSQLLSPDFMHHPAHTSSHVHKARLYSPYATPGHMTPRNGLKREAALPGPIRGGWASSSSSERPPPPKLRPLSDMNKFLGAVFREDGTVAESIPRSALGLPGIQSFVALAQEGAAKPELMDVDTDSQVQFPTHEDVVIGACTCGDDCECPSCATHGNAPASESNEPHCCGESCKSSFDCADHLSLPKGITSIDHLLSFAAANVPHPVQRKVDDLSAHAQDTRILPPSAMVNEDAARLYGVVSLKPLECCNGRCQCPPRECTCNGECCGCCMHCSCDDGDGDTKMEDGGAKQTGGCCSGTTTEVVVDDNGVSASASASASADQSSPSSSSQSSRRPSLALRSASPLFAPDPKVPSPAKSANESGDASPSSGATLAPSGSITRGHSPRPSISSGTSVRRASSTSQQGSKSTASSRRATITQGSTIQRAASTGKSASKALALHTTPNHPHPHPHPRPILPKPSNGQGQVQGGGNAKSCCGSGRSSASTAQTLAAPSSSNSRDVSPAFGPTTFSDQTQTQQPFSSILDPGQIPTLSIPSLPPNGLEGEENGLDPNISMSDADIMALINQFAPSTDANNSLDFGAPTDYSTATTTADTTFGAGAGTNLVDLGGDNSAFFAQFMAALSGQHQQNEQQQLQQQQQQDASHQHCNPSPFDIQSTSANGTPSNSVQSDFGAASGTAANEPLSVYQQFPSQSTAFLQQIFAHNPAFITGSDSDGNPSGPNGYNPPTTSGGNNGAGAGGGGKHNPDVIDLSKPLNASDVERILRALQEQQGRQNVQHPLQPQPQQQQRQQQQQQQQQQQASQPQLQPSQQSQSQQPHNQSSVGSGVDMNGFLGPPDLEPYSTTSTTTTMDEMFHNFVFGSPAGASNDVVSNLSNTVLTSSTTSPRLSAEESKQMFYALLQRGTGA